MLRVYDQSMTLVDSMLLPREPEFDRDDPPGAFAFRIGETGNGFAQVPFYPAGSDVFDPEGGVWSVPPGDPSYRIYRWVPEGDTTLVLEVARSPLPVTAAEKEEAIDGILASLSRYNVKTVDDSKVPNVKPAVSSMFVSADGDLWVRIPGSAEGATYDVFRRDGERLGTVHTPFAPVSFLSPFVRGDEMWAVARDELDIQYVVRGRIQGAFRDEPLETRSGQGGS
jgi:hypothetical protein